MNSARHIIARLLEDEDDEILDASNMLPVKTEKPNQKYLPLGSISHGTMITRHLIARFFAALDEVDPEKREKLESEYEEGLAEVQDNDEIAIEEYREEFCWNALSNALEEHCPPYTYFGANEGDGSDYGVWISVESIEEVIKFEDTDEIRAVEPQEEVYYPTHSEYVLIRRGPGEYDALLDGMNGKVIWRI